MTENSTQTFDAEAVRLHIGERLDVFLAGAMDRSRAHVQKLLKAGLVELHPNATKNEAGYRLRAGDSIMVHAGSVTVEKPGGEPAGEDIPLHIIYEDEVLLVINKQPGLVVHPAAGNWSGTLVNALVHHRSGQLARRGGEERMGLVHRLDKDTSGLLLIAKNDLAHEALSRAFSEREVKKIYRALCKGVFRRASGECRGLIGRHPVHRQKMAVTRNPKVGRASWTDYRVLTQGKFGAEVECHLHTGRTHQIRVHLAHLGHPIWGDLVYGQQWALPVDGIYPARQMLHAAHLEIAHPLTGRPLVLDAPLPEDYAEARKRLLT